jgi:hypothetical protein
LTQLQWIKDNVDAAAGVWNEALAIDPNFIWQSERKQALEAKESSARYTGAGSRKTEGEAYGS